MARKKKSKAPKRLILDSGAVIALSRRDQRVRAFISESLKTGAMVEVPAVVVAETVRDSRRAAPINQVLKAIDAVTGVTEEIARTAGRLLGKAGLAATVDALVVAQAVHAGGAHILTSDADDLERLAAPHPEVWIQPF